MPVRKKQVLKGQSERLLLRHAVGQGDEYHIIVTLPPPRGGLKSPTTPYLKSLTLEVTFLSRTYLGTLERGLNWVDLGVS
jgi:hypothetical protein